MSATSCALRMDLMTVLLSSISSPQHVARRHEILVVVLDLRELGDLADGAQRDAADLADPLGQIVDRTENLVALFIEHQMIITEMPAADMPVEVLGLDVEREGVGPPQD